MTPTRIAGIDRPLSALALGTAFYHPDQQDLCEALLDAYLAAGGTVVDTARHYGRSEEVVGRWLRQRGARERILLVTKGGHGEDYRLPERDLARILADDLQLSLQTLHTDSVDLYMLHRDNHEVPVAAILDALQELVASGRARVLGASNWEYRRIAEANEHAERHGLTGFSVVSNTLSLAHPVAAFYPGLVHTDPAGEDWHRQTGTPLMPWSSQARGFFASDLTPAQRRDPALASPPAPTFVSRMLKVYGTHDNFARRDRAASLAAQRGCTAMELCLAWVLHKPFPIVPIVGPRTPAELASCLRAATVPLSAQEQRWLWDGGTC